MMAGRAWVVPSAAIAVLAAAAIAFLAAAAAAAAAVHTVGIARAVAGGVGKALHVLLWADRRRGRRRGGRSVTLAAVAAAAAIWMGAAEGIGAIPNGFGFVKGRAEPSNEGRGERGWAVVAGREEHMVLAQVRHCAHESAAALAA